MPSRPELDRAMLAYYDEGREAARLERPGSLERLRTWELFARFLPPPPAVVLDVGGGTGVHARHLLEVGHSVTLIDPVPLHAAGARGNGVTGALVGDARRLPVGDRTADAVLLLGPLYHLVDPADRLEALREARRAVVPGGVVLVAAISRFASTIDGLVRGLLRTPGFEAIVSADVASGVHRNPDRRPGWFTTAYFHRPDELGHEVVESGLRLDGLLAIEGPASLLPDHGSWMSDPDDREAVLRAIRRVEREPSLLGASSHLMAIGSRGSEEP